MKLIKSALWQLTALCVGLILVFPLIYAVFGAFKTPAEFGAWPPSLLPDSFGNLENFKAVFKQIPMLRYMLNSLITSLITGAVKTLLSCLAAYGFAYYDFRGKKALFFLILAAMMLPADTLILTNYRTVTRLGLIDTYLGICVVSFVGASQLLLLRGELCRLPASLWDAAKMDGCGDLRYLALILMPMERGILLTLFLQAFVAQWNSYLWPLLVTTRTDMRTVQVGISMLTSAENTNYETVLAGSVAALVPSLILFFMSRKSFTGADASGAEVE